MLKPIFSLLVGLILTFSLSTNLYAQEDTTVPDSPAPGENVAVPAEDVEITTTNFNDPLALQEGAIILFTHEDCPHCANVEAFMNSNGITTQVKKYQLKNNDENMELIKEYWKFFEVTSAEEGWPFMVYVNDGQIDYSVGDTPIISDLSSLLGIEEPVEVTPEPSGSNNLLIIVGGLFFAAIAGYGLYSLFSNKNAGTK